MVEITIRKPDAIAARKERVDRALGILRALGKVKYPKALSVICYNIGVSDSKAREYIRLLENAEEIQIVDHHVIPSKKKGGANE